MVGAGGIEARDAAVARLVALGPAGPRPGVQGWGLGQAAVRRWPEDGGLCAAALAGAVGERALAAAASQRLFSRREETGGRTCSRAGVVSEQRRASC